MLDARDRRAAIQDEMLGRPEAACLVCLTLNIAGDIKRTPVTRFLFDRGVREFSSLGMNVISHLVIDEPTGSEAFWLLGKGTDAEQVKQKLEAIEDSFPAARLFDFDVLVRSVEDKCEQTRFRKLSRAVSRKCLICGRPAAECARSRNHGLDAVKEAINKLLMEYCAGALADAAVNSLLDELYTTPKPGLVDLMSCGAHQDMDVPLFEKSAGSLRPYFHDAVIMGLKGCSMKELRERGLAAENEMFSATGGVNTHKGMVYSMGLLLAGMGKALNQSVPDSAVTFAADLAGQDAERLLAESLSDPKTNGGKVLKNYGARGAMGEAAAGFPAAGYCAARLRYYSDHAEPESAGALTFCDSMAVLEDTNLLHRGGRAGLDFARAEASRIAALEDYGERIAQLAELDGEMIRRNLSPGGSADMLALAYLLERWHDLFRVDTP